MSKNNPNFIKRSQRVRSALKKRAKGKARLSVFRSGMHIYAQLIDDVNGITLASASTREKEISKELNKTSNREAASVVGKLIATRALEKNCNLEVVFDRGGHIYHGRLKALADAARLGGLNFNIGIKWPNKTRSLISPLL